MTQTFIFTEPASPHSVLWIHEWGHLQMTPKGFVYKTKNYRTSLVYVESM